MNLNKRPIEPQSNQHISDLESEMITYAEVQGKQNGLVNKPNNMDELKALVMNFIESRVQSCVNENQQAHLPFSGMILAKKIQSEAKQKIESIHADLNDCEHRMQQLIEKIKRVLPDLKKRKLRLCVYVGAGIVSLAEGYFAYEALRQASFPIPAAIVTALGIAVSIGFGSHVLAGYILKAKTSFQKWLRYSCVLIPAAIGFYFLGDLRADSYNNVSHLHNAIRLLHESKNSDVSGLGITIISFLLFVITLLFSIHFYNSDDECLREQEYDRLRDEINWLSSKIRSERNLIRNIEKATNEQVAEAFERFEFAVAAERKLQSIANHCLEVYKDSNLRHRTDGACPPFFSYPPSFNFKLFFDHSYPKQ